MSVAELLPTIQSLPHSEKVELYRILTDELIRDEQAQLADAPILLRPEDGCPYSADELARMRRQADGRPLAEIWRSLGCP